jgi:ABC-2 type transport system permease protein
MNRWYPFTQLFLARFREFYREPEAVFWVYGFPVLLAIGLGIAFSSREPEPPIVDVADVAPHRADARALVEHLEAAHLPAELHDPEACRQRLRTGKTALFVVPTAEGFRYVYDPARAESVLARARVNDVIVRWKAGVEAREAPTGSAVGADERVTEWQAGARPTPSAQSRAIATSTS